VDTQSRSIRLPASGRRESHAYANRISQRYGDSYCHRYRYSDSNRYCYAYCNSHTFWKADADSKASSDAKALTITRTSGPAQIDDGEPQEAEAPPRAGKPASRVISGFIGFLADAPDYRGRRPGVPLPNA
jgi:hypothetical protein